MSRSVSSFRMLIDIERSEWIDFKKKLRKEDKQRFDRLFSVPKLYHHTLSDLSNPITIESIIPIKEWKTRFFLKIDRKKTKQSSPDLESEL